jgi:hypothetical protein
MSMTDSDSDLTPQSSDNEEDDDSMQIEQDLTPKRTKKNDPTPKSHDRKGKGKAEEPAKNKHKETGPRGRERKRNTKMEEVERRRARDAKFDDSNLASVGPLRYISANCSHHHARCTRLQTSTTLPPLATMNPTMAETHSLTRPTRMT